MLGGWEYKDDCLTEKVSAAAGIAPAGSSWGNSSDEGEGAYRHASKEKDDLLADPSW